MGAYERLSTYFTTPLVDYARNYGYDPSNIVILEGDIDRFQRDYPQIYNNLLSCRHHADNRSPISYGRDLIASWIFEDYILHELSNGGLNIQLDGADLNRIILPRINTSNTCDYIIRHNGAAPITMELVCDYTGFWSNTGTLHLRDNKYTRLDANNSLLLAISLSRSNSEYALIDFSQNVPALYLEYHRPWNKPAYQINISRNMFIPFNPNNVITSINNILHR